jgi:hypothetical protein
VRRSVDQPWRDRRLTNVRMPPKADIRLASETGTLRILAPLRA